MVPKLYEFKSDNLYIEIPKYSNNEIKLRTWNDMLLYENSEYSVVVRAGEVVTVLEENRLDMPKSLQTIYYENKINKVSGYLCWPTGLSLFASLVAIAIKLIAPPVGLAVSVSLLILLVVFMNKSLSARSIDIDALLSIGLHYNQEYWPYFDAAVRSPNVHKSHAFDLLNQSFRKENSNPSFKGYIVVHKEQLAWISSHDLNMCFREII